MPYGTVHTVYSGRIGTPPADVKRNKLRPSAMDFRAPLQLEGILPIKTHCPPISSSSSSFQSLQLPAELSASTENPRLLSFILFRPEHETATPPCRRLICRLESSSQEAKLHTSSSSLSRASSHTSSSPPTSPPNTRLSSWSSIPWVQSWAILRLEHFPGSSTRNTGDLAAP